MGQRKARLTYAKTHGVPVPPPVNAEMVVEETILLFKRVSKRIDQEYALSAYHKQLSRVQYIALLIESALNHEEKLRDEAAAEGSLVKLVTKLPPGIAEAAKRLEKMKR